MTLSRYLHAFQSSASRGKPRPNWKSDCATNDSRFQEQTARLTDAGACSSHVIRHAAMHEMRGGMHGPGASVQLLDPRSLLDQLTLPITQHGKHAISFVASSWVWLNRMSTFLYTRDIGYKDISPCAALVSAVRSITAKNCLGLGRASL